jgi:hypothetical protein
MFKILFVMAMIEEALGEASSGQSVQEVRLCRI